MCCVKLKLSICTHARKHTQKPRLSMVMRRSILSTSRSVATASPTRADHAADSLITLVQSCYPFASVVFPLSSNHAVRQPCSSSGDLEVLKSALAARRGLMNETADVSRLLARVSWDLSVATAPSSCRWWEVISHFSPPQRLYASLSACDENPLSTSSSSSSFACFPQFCPDAVVYIEGVEATDVAAAVAPRLIQNIPSVLAVDSVGSGLSTHGGERQAPTYCRRKVDWESHWHNKRCALRGVDVMELSLPISTFSTNSRTRDAARVSLLVSVADPGVTLPILHRQKNSVRRGALRSTFGYSLPCLRSALPDAAVRCVRRLRAWQQRVNGAYPPCTSAFWVSAVGHLLGAAVARDDEFTQLVRGAVEKWLSVPVEETRLTVAETRLLQTLLQLSSSTLTLKAVAAAAPAEEVPVSMDRAASDLLAHLLFSVLVQKVLSAPYTEWNASNYFLPSERFDGTTDADSVTALSRCDGAAAASFTRSAWEEGMPQQQTRR